MLTSVSSLFGRRTISLTPMRGLATATGNSSGPIGFIGLGHMGSKMVHNISSDGNSMVVYDVNFDTAKALESESVCAVQTIEELSQACSTIITMLPNDNAVKSVSDIIMLNSQPGLIHVGCSTVSPTTSRNLAADYTAAGKTFIAAPVFARPDGLLKRQATWMVAGEEKGRAIAGKLLESSGAIVDYGDDTGSANVVKLCGNFLIASSIEAIGEAVALSEKNGVDGKEVIKLLSGTIFDCLIYKGYGQRVSERDHRPGGFSLELGLKDVSLVNQAARECNTPMPFLSVLLDRFVSAKARGRGGMDWSAIGMCVSENAGIDMKEDVDRNQKAVDTGDVYK